MSMNRILFLLLALVFAAPAWSHEGCFSIVAGKDATADGSMLLGHNEDCNPREFAGMRKVEARDHESGAFAMLPGGGRIPLPSRTFGYWHMQMPQQDYCDAVLNECGLVVFSNSCPSREDRPEFTDGGIGGPHLRLLVAELFPERRLVPVPFDHPIYHAVYDLDGPPKIHEHDGKPPEGLGVFDGERLILFYTYESDIGDGLEDADVHGDPSETREQAIRMAVNVLYFALTQ